MTCRKMIATAYGLAALATFLFAATLTSGAKLDTVELPLTKDMKNMKEKENMTIPYVKCFNFEAKGAGFVSKLRKAKKNKTDDCKLKVELIKKDDPRSEIWYITYDENAMEWSLTVKEHETIAVKNKKLSKANKKFRFVKHTLGGVFSKAGAKVDTASATGCVDVKDKFFVGPVANDVEVAPTVQHQLHICPGNDITLSPNASGYIDVTYKTKTDNQKITIPITKAPKTLAEVTSKES